MEKALSFEVVRQAGLVRMGAEIQRETRHFDAEFRTTKSLRKKEYEEDYGYIFDPDLPRLTLGKKYVDRLVASMPDLPDQIVKRFVGSYGISEYYAGVIVYTGKPMAAFFEECIKLHNSPKQIANWIVNYLMKSLNWRSERVEGSKARPDTFVELVRMIENGEITERYAKELVKAYVDTGKSPRELAKADSVSLGAKDIKRIINSIISSNAKAVEEYRSGKGAALQFLIGQALKETRKQADPKVIKELMLKELTT